MDSARIKIINHDLSTTTSSPSTPEYKGFTVVRSPKGPSKPVFIENLTELKNHFGSLSEDYPELYEVETFVEKYPCWVSAPYDVENSSVPVAYITEKGVFLSKENIKLSSKFEELAAGDNSVSIDGITQFDTDNPSVWLSSKDHQTLIAPYPAEDAAANSPLVDDNVAEPRYSDSNYWKFFKKHVTSSDAESDDLLDKCSCIYYIIDRAVDIEDDPSNTFSSFRVKGFEENGAKYIDVTVGSSIDSDGLLGASKFNSKTINLTKVKALTTKNNDTSYPIGYLFNVSVGTVLAFIQPEPIPGYIWNDLNNKTADDGYSVEDLYLQIEREISASDIKATIYPKNISNSEVVEVSIQGHSKKPDVASQSLANSNRFKIVAGNGSIEGSLIPNDKAADGALISFYNNPDSYCPVGIYVIDSCSATADTNPIFKANKNDYTSFQFDGIIRSQADTANSWSYALEEQFSDVNIFFDPAVHYIDSTGSKSSSLGDFTSIASTHELAGCIFNLTPKTDKNFKISNVSKLNDGPNYWNICNVGKIRFESGKYKEVAMTGAAAANMMRILKDHHGGVAPMYLDNGELFSGVTRVPASLVYTYSKQDQLLLDEKNFNPVIQLNNSSSSSPYIIAGHKTCKSGEVTDWSYIGHVASFLQFQREVREEVMFPQIGKANNQYYRDLRAYQVEQILRSRIEGPNPIWAQAIVDTSTNPGVNDIAAQKARKFVINVRVKVNVFSEWVELNFTNVAQDMDV